MSFSPCSKHAGLADRPRSRSPAARRSGRPRFPARPARAGCGRRPGPSSRVRAVGCRAVQQQRARDRPRPAAARAPHARRRRAGFRGAVQVERQAAGGFGRQHAGPAQRGQVGASLRPRSPRAAFGRSPRRGGAAAALRNSPAQLRGWLPVIRSPWCPGDGLRGRGPSVPEAPRARGIRHCRREVSAITDRRAAQE